MNERPKLSKELTPNEFKSFYYLKSELIDFCKELGIFHSGNKQDLEKRIILFFKTGEISKENNQSNSKTTHQKTQNNFDNISQFLSTKISENYVCSETDRKFFKQVIGKSFSFKVEFQNWLKNNSGKTYGDAVTEYKKIIEQKKQNKSKIGEQFQYNTYIRDFFEDNKDKTFSDAIKCWNYKKQLCGNHKYNRSDLEILN